MKQREEATLMANQILADGSDHGWLSPLAKEFLAMVEREASRLKPDTREYFREKEVMATAGVVK